MKIKKKWLPSMLVMTGVFTLGMNASAANIQKDQLAFVQCNSCINIRSQANTDSAIVGKLYHNNAVTVLEIIDDEWCMISSGNAVGYMKYQHLVAGEEAWAIENEVAQKVAIVQAKALNVRAGASADSRIIDVVHENQELTVVEYDGGAWVKVALAPDSIGYIDAALCSCKTYYPVAEVVDSTAEVYYEVPSYDETAYTEPSYEETYEESYEETYEESYEEAYEAPAYDWNESSAETVYEETYEGSYEEPSYDWNETYEEPSYEETYEEPAYDWNETYEESSYEESYEEPSYEAPAYDWNETYGEPSYEDEGAYDYGYEEPSASTGSGSGQAIVDYALQFVGNPYVYGGTSLTNGTDCSGFTQSVLSNFDVDLARVAADQAYGGQSIDVQDAQAGDLLFYSDGSGISHVGIYMGNGQIVHAATEDQGIIVSDSNYSTPVAAARYW